MDALWTRSGGAMRGDSVVEVRLEDRAVVLRLRGGEVVARLQPAEARDLAVRLLEAAHVARVRRRREAAR